MEELYTGDAFGNELHIGDTVIAATQIIQSPVIKMGKIIAMSKGKPYEKYDANNGGALHKVAKWKIQWIIHPIWTYLEYLPKESIVHGLNLVKYNEKEKEN